MESVRPKSLGLGRILTLLFVLSGGIAGYFLGRQAVIWETIIRLNHYSKLAIDQNDASIGEARKTLDTLKKSLLTTCADDEIGYLRELVFRSDRLKDAGRIDGDRIACSATSGRVSRSLAALSSDFARSEGITYYNLRHTSKSEQGRAALQLNDAFVVFNSSESLNQDTDPVHLDVTAGPGKTVTANQLPALLASFFETASKGTASGQAGEMLYSTRCSKHGLNCITLSVPAAYVLQNGNAAIPAFAGVGALTGLLFGMFVSRLRMRNRDLARQLNRALDRNKLEVVYQPIVNLATQMCVGAEALARWTDEDGNVVEPDVFVKTAEERGFVCKLTKVVLRQVLHDFATTMQSRPGFHISMNVAGADLSDPDFLPLLDESLKKVNVKPESLIIEITERSASDGPDAMETIRNLRRGGYGIHIDDFGTGHSNLDKLLYLYADTIKIDKAFTKVIGTESVAVAILPQILKMAKSLGLGVVVEGIETQQQSDYFCPGQQKIYGQGWLYGRPGSAEALQTLLAINQPLALPRKETLEEEFEFSMATPPHKPMPNAIHLVRSKIA